MIKGLPDHVSQFFLFEHFDGYFLLCTSSQVNGGLFWADQSHKVMADGLQLPNLMVDEKFCGFTNVGCNVFRQGRI